MSDTSFTPDRRSFLKTLSVAATGVVLGSAMPAFAQATQPKRRRYAIVGVGSRHQMYQDAIETTYRDDAELVGICDTNPGRLELARRRSQTNRAVPPPAYLARDFDRMVRETKPEFVIVTTIDGTHHEYIVRAMELGCDVISEKPLTTTAEKYQQIVAARNRTGRKIRVTFNLRYSPPRAQVKELLMNGEIGDILSADFHWMLNTHHGTDYFRRWHSHKVNSGGLMVHKATHHFDLMNWWLSANPVSVFATGKRDFYTPKMAKRLGLSGPHERCHTCPEKARCTFFLDLAASEDLRTLYLENEKYDGYFRDRCVFREDIDIEDTMNVLVNYDSGATLAYSLNAFNAWEGYHVVFNGTKGRLEHSTAEKIYINGIGAQGELADGGVTTRIIPLRGKPRDIKPWNGQGEHGGGDRMMLEEIFRPSGKPDRYLRNSDERGGAASCLIGIAADRCFETKLPVNIAELVPGIEPAIYPPMPPHAGPVPMPVDEA